MIGHPSTSVENAERDATARGSGGPHGGCIASRLNATFLRIGGRAQGRRTLRLPKDVGDVGFEKFSSDFSLVAGPELVAAAIPLFRGRPGGGGMFVARKPEEHLPIALPEASATADLRAEAFACVIVELAPDGILVSDDHGRIIMANSQVEELFGFDRDALIGQPVETLLPAWLRQAHEAHRVDYATAPMLRPMGAGLKLLGRHADGSEFPIEISLSPIAADHGLATVVIIRDVSKQRDLETAAQQASRSTITNASPQNCMTESSATCSHPP